jgi:membrane protein DedA with SNARE-associated domain
VFEWIVSIIDKGGYLGIFFLMFLENVFPPIPSELIMPTAGLLAVQGKFSFLLVVVAGSLGSFAGQGLLYYLGYRVGEERLKRWARSHGHWVAVSADEIDRGKLWFQRRRGSMAVFLGRLVPGFRSVISVPAGLVKMPLARFMIFTLLGTVIWTAALAAAGGLIGENYDRVERFLDPITYIVVLSMVGSYLWRVFKRYRGDGLEVGAAG